MEIRKNQNLGFGNLHVRFDEKKVGRKVFNQIENFIGTQYAKGKDNYTTRVFYPNRTAYDIKADNEPTLAKKLRKLGAEVREILDPTESLKALKEDLNWVFDKK